MRWVLLVAVVAGVWFWAASDGEAKKVECKEGFAWGGECRTQKDGRSFVAWLNQHGTSAKVFKRNHPELAATFKQPWPPKPKLEAWQSCENGYACARAVIQHYFGSGWEYALRIVGCETGGTYSKYVRGSAGEVSWWQFHPVHFGWLDEARAVADPRYATKVAYRMSRGGSDWGPWTCARLI